MGRYYNGDIEGKFWFAVQSSDAADQFGCSGTQEYLNYYFDEDALPTINKRIKELKECLGTHKEEFDYFFEKNNGYNNTMIKEQTSMKDNEYIKQMLSLYADLDLGVKIRDCVIEHGECQFDAEL